jgi:hypothetical protein
VPIQSATPIPLPATAPSGAIRLLEPENEKEMKWGAWITFRWDWTGTVQEEQYLELRIDDKHHAMVDQPETGQVRAQLEIEKGRHFWSIVWMSRDSSYPILESEKRWFTLN